MVAGSAIALIPRDAIVCDCKIKHDPQAAAKADGGR